MTPEFASEAQRDVWAALQRINAAWLRGEVEGLDAVLHARMVIEPPGFQQRTEGAAACAAGYQEFARSASVQSYEEADVRVDVYGATAVVRYRYDLTYLMEDVSYQDSGHDLYVFVQEDGRWQAVWRTLIPLAPEAGNLLR